MKTFHYDIIVIGSGIVGSVVALALAKNPQLKIALIDAQSPSPFQLSDQYDYRVSAISLASKSIFENLNVWDKILVKRSSVYTHMHVWEETNQSKIDFDCKDIHESALGYILEDNVMRSSLHEEIHAQSNIIFHHPIKLIALQNTMDCIEVRAEDAVFAAKLLIAADGANSWVRDQVFTDVKKRSYDHTAIVATVATEFPHQMTAWQCFLKTGPLAFLPLENPLHSSIVWSTLPDHANKLLALDDASFCQEISEAFGNKLGTIKHVSKRYHFPLTMRHVQNYVQPRIALIGDAAHTIHPLAGQGVNLGLLDADMLAEVIKDAINKRRDFASMATLRRFERQRKSDNLTMLWSIDLIKKLFMSNIESVQKLRNIGLNFTDRTSLLKKFFVNYAVGNRS